MTRPAPPYFLVSDDAVSAVEFLLATPNGEVPLPEFLDDWDYNTDLTIRAKAEVDRGELVKSAHLDDSDTIVWTFGWRTIDGNLTGGGPVLQGAGEGPVTFELTLPGQQVGAALELTLRVVFLRSSSPAKVGKVSLPGSVLWEARRRLALSGEGARFPIQILDFATSSLDHDASWCVDLATDLETPVLGGLVLLVNSADEALIDAITGQAAVDTVLYQTLQEGTSVQLLDTAITRADEVSQETWPEDSVGALLAGLLHRLGDALPGVLEERLHRPGQYHARLVGEARRQGLGRTFR